LESYFTFNSKILFGVTKKLKNWLNRENQEKNNRKNRTVKKKPIKPIRILKKLTGSVRFRFYKPETEKTKPNPNRKKPSRARKNRVKPKKTEQNRKTQKNRAKLEKTEPNRFELVFVLKKPNRNLSVWTGFGFFFKKIQFGYFFW